MPGARWLLGVGLAGLWDMPPALAQSAPQAMQQAAFDHAAFDLWQLQAWLAAGLLVLSGLMLWAWFRHAPSSTTTPPDWEVPRDAMGHPLPAALVAWLDARLRGDVPPVERALAAGVAALAAKGLVELSPAPSGYDADMRYRGRQTPADLPVSEELLLEWLFRDGDRLRDTTSDERIMLAHEELPAVLQQQAEILAGDERSASSFLPALLALLLAVVVLGGALYLAPGETQRSLVLAMGALGGMLALFFSGLWKRLLYKGSTRLTAQRGFILLRPTQVVATWLLLLFTAFTALSALPGVWQVLAAHPFIAAAAISVALVPGIVHRIVQDGSDRAGIALLRQLDGLRRFIAGSERARLDVLMRNDPQAALQHELLPHAVALGEAGEWWRQFEEGLAVRLARAMERRQREQLRLAREYTRYMRG